MNRRGGGERERTGANSIGGDRGALNEESTTLAAVHTLISSEQRECQEGKAEFSSGPFWPLPERWSWTSYMWEHFLPRGVNEFARKNRNQRLHA